MEGYRLRHCDEDVQERDQATHHYEAWTTDEDVHIRRIWSLSKGVLIDECEVDRTADHVLNRELREPDDIRVELVLKGAQSLYMRPRPDVAEIYSNPRICQEATLSDSTA